jgi:hypothetical protein
MSLTDPFIYGMRWQSSVSYSKFPRLLPSDASALHSTENGHLKGPGLSHVGNVGLIVGKREAPAADSYGKLTQEGPLAEVRDCSV